MDYNNIWNSFLLKIEEKLLNIHYKTWFKETKLFSIDNSVAKVIVPSGIHKKHLKENYYTLVEEIFNDITGSNFTIEFFLQEELEDIETINEFDVIKTGVPSHKNPNSNLKKSYTFDNFIVGLSNKFAATTALAIAEKPGTMYNPLFLYSKSGLGKTHLMHAIGNYIEGNSNMNVLYVTSEQFVNDFTDLHRRNKNVYKHDLVDNFKAKYRDIDVLMIDDIQYLEIAEKTQQEFFNTFNDLHTKNKQIIISSDRSPDDLKLLEERLRTRFNWGLTVDIQPPNFELRYEIITKKIESNSLFVNISDDVKEYIASNCTTDIRKLEGAITRIIAYATMMGGKNIDLELSKHALKDYFGNCIISKNKIDHVQQVVAAHYNISIDDIKSKKRNQSIAFPRQIAMYISRVIYDENLAKIGVEFGGKNHTTVIHSVEKIKKEILKNKDLDKEIQKIVNKIK